MLYENKSGDATQNAQGNLMGRTHYVDPDTLRWHKSRLLSARAICNGWLFAIVESVAIDMHNTKRGFRYVLFDICGNVVGNRVDLEHCWSRRDPAVKAMWNEVNSLDVKALTLEAIGRKEREHARYIAEVREKLATAQFAAPSSP